MADNPFVSVVFEASGRRFTALQESSLSPGDHDALVAEAIGNLDGMSFTFEPRTIEGGQPATMYRCVDPFASESILSPRHMTELQRMLTAPALAVAVPSEGVLLATSAAPDNAAARSELSGLAGQLFGDAGAKGITPLLFLVQGGRLLGSLEVPTGSR